MPRATVKQVGDAREMLRRRVPPRHDRRTIAHPRKRARSARRPDARFLAGAVVGAGLAFLLEPARSRRGCGRTSAALRHAGRRLERALRVRARRVVGRSRGALHVVMPLHRGAPLDDAGLAHKVETVLFRDSRVPKGRLSINAEDGAVFLRGEVEGAELIDELATAVRRIRGVDDVVNLLHLPGTEAPHVGPGHPRPLRRSA
jgi:hypothetical protein